MKMFDKNINKEIIKDKAAKGIANGILRSQNIFSKYMGVFTQKWKPKQQWIFLCAVCLFFGGLSITAIVIPFKTKRMKTFTIPKSIIGVAIIHQQTRVSAITENEMKQVQEYKNKYPNLEKERPGLFDSLSLIEQVYYSQKK